MSDREPRAVAVAPDTPPSMPTRREHPLDPPAELARLRARGPLSRLSYPDGHVGWLVTGYALAREVLTDNRFSGAMELRRLPVHFPAGEEMFGAPAPPGGFAVMDPPEHTRFRRVLNREFTAGAVERLTPAIEAAVAKQLDAMGEAGPPVDLVQSFALPVPLLTICALLGVPYADHDEFVRLHMAAVSFASSKEQAAAARAGLEDYLGALATRKRERREDDLLSVLATSGEFSDEEIAGVGGLLLTAGFETVASMVSLGVLTLLSEPEQLAALTGDPALMEDAVEELLRYLSIVHLVVTRTALEDVELDGEVVAAGETVTVSLPAANRDPARFERPEAFDIARSARGHLAFVHGIHSCLGQHLARLELRIALRELFARFPTLQLDARLDELEFGTGLDYGVDRVPVSW